MKRIVQLKPAIQQLCEKYFLSEKIEGQLFDDLKEDACYDEAVHHVEEDVVEEVPETKLESKTQSQGQGHSSRRAQILVKQSYIILRLPDQVGTSKQD